MECCFNTVLKGCVVLTSDFHNNRFLQKDKSLYKFIWVRKGSVTLEVDHVEMTIEKDEIVSFTPLHRIVIRSAEGDYLALLFNRNFYCIYGHDREVSCDGLLFNGTSTLMRLHLSEIQSVLLREITDKMAKEYEITDNLQEEMLRILLKRFIITCTRMAREKFSVTAGRVKSIDLVRRFYVLLDQHFKEKKRVQDYADLLYRSPKTLNNLFSSYGLPSPLQIIHERIEAEAKRLLLYTPKSATEIADILGFEDMSAFSRFFRNRTGKSISEFRKPGKRE